MSERPKGHAGLVNAREQRLLDGERTSPAGKPVANKILLSISDTDYRRIRPYLEFLDLPHHFSLHEPAGKLKFAYFLNQGMASIVVATKGGRDVEAGVVGREGAIGTELAVGLDRNPLREMMQIEGHGFRVSARELTIALADAPDFQMKLSRYAVLQGMQVAQTAACNRLHGVQQRLARWLLMAQDRLDDGILPITHEFLAIMLGTDRPSVSLAAATLQENSLIQYARGSVKVLNRKKLETFACVCYRVIQQLNGELGLK